jgi:hypothetical protein
MAGTAILRCLPFAIDRENCSFGQMQIIARLRITLLITALVLVSHAGRAAAQSGSAGGSVGNDDKAISGTRPQPANREAPRDNVSERKSGRTTPRPNAAARQAGCVLVRTQTSTPGCYGFVGFANGVRVGWLRRQGMWVRSGSGEKCQDRGISATPLGKDAVRLSDGTRMRLDATCRNGQDF